MTKTLGRGPTRAQKTLNLFAAVALLASLLTVYMPLPAQAANNAEFTFFFDNGAVLDTTNDVGGDYTIPDQFFIDYYGGVGNIPDGFDYQGRTLHVSCSETFPNGYASSGNDFPAAPPSSDDDNGWGIQSYTIVRHLPSGDRFCGETFEPAEITVVKNTTPETADEFTFRLVGQMFPDPPQKDELVDFGPDDQDVAGDGGSYTWEVNSGNFTLSELIGQNPAGYEFDAVSCSVAGGGPNPGFVEDGASVSFDILGGQHVTCTFHNEGLPPEPGIIIVDKQVTEGSDPTQVFDFDASYDGDGFSLSGDSNPNNSGDLDPGTYSVSEDPLPGWTLESATCDDGSDPSSIALGAGETVTCTFVNHEIQPGTIVVEKVVTDGSSTNTVFTFDETGFSLDDNTLADGESGSATVDPGGNYSVEENVPEGWTLVSAACDDEDSTPGDINVDEGETVTCTFENHEIQPGTVTVIKNVVGDQTTEFTFTGDVAGTIGHGESISETAQLDETYSSTEVVPEGWELTDISCVADGGTYEIDGDGVNMTVAEEDGSVTCTFTNTEDGEIIVEKEVLGNSDQAQTFDFSPVGFTLGDTSLAHGEQSSSGPISPGGDYSVSETVPGGWTLVSATCDDGSDPSDINVAAGETVTCTFVNGEVSSITVVKQALPADPEDDTTFAFNGDLSGSLGDDDSDTATVGPGTYQTTETQVEDWTLVSIVCDDGATGDVESLTATYEVGYGDDITCTFTNVENEVLASVLVTVSGACIPDGDEGIGRITINMSVDGAANVVVRDSDGDVVGSRSTSGTITVPEGATYTWEATANEGFEFPVDFDPTGQVTIDTCSEDEELPFTGLNMDTALAIATLMLVAGLMMVRSTTGREES